MVPKIWLRNLHVALFIVKIHCGCSMRFPSLGMKAEFFTKAGESTVNSTGFPTGQNASAWVRMHILTKGKFHMAFSYLH